MKKDRKYFFCTGLGAKAQPVPNLKAWNAILLGLISDGQPYHVVIDFKPNVTHYTITLDV